MEWDNPLFIDLASYLETDQGYTYPDFNTPWLAFDGYVGGQRVIKPSFFFPQYFPDYRSGGSGFRARHSMSTPCGRFCIRTIPLAIVAAMPSITDVDMVRGCGTSTFRFLTAPTLAQSGDTSRILPPFPFEVDADNDGIYGEMGVWTGDDSYDLPVDVDNDGTPDSVRIDIGAGIVDLPGGRQVVPLYVVQDHRA